MNLTQLRSLIAVAEAGSFTAAAMNVGVTQSGMSQALAMLEESLGVKLLARHRHGVELTAFGERALHHARAALAHLDAIGKEAAEAAGEEAVSVRIAAFPSVFSTVLPPLLRRFRSLHPCIELIALETDDREVEVLAGCRIHRPRRRPQPATGQRCRNDWTGCMGRRSTNGASPWKT
ncbi:LysR family transcriptional regulator [Agrobacterium radiobacter]|uniref:LysR family transcriptional regulator n=1 Tax=Agrobacterium radiobacter TaxID=362 RepID=UPI003CE57B5C